MSEMIRSNRFAALTGSGYLQCYCPKAFLNQKKHPAAGRTRTANNHVSYICVIFHMYFTAAAG